MVARIKGEHMIIEDATMEEVEVEEIMDMIIKPIF